MAGLAEKLFVRIVVRAATPQRHNVVDCCADAHAVMAQAFLAQPVVAPADALAVLYTLPATHTLNRVRPRRIERSETLARHLQPRLERLQLCHQ
jgi:hypothetical protein